IYKVVFFTSGVGMLVSLLWFWFGRRALKGIGEPLADQAHPARIVYVVLGALVAVPIMFMLLSVAGEKLQWVLTAMFVGLAVMLVIEGVRDGAVARDKTFAMLIIFVFNIMFWMFFEQAGSSFTFLAKNIVNRNLGGFVFPTAWFQSVNSLAIITLAPVMAWIWIWMAK